MPPLPPSLPSSRPTALAGRPPLVTTVTSTALAAGLPQGSAQATTQTHPALSEPPLGAPAVPSGLNAASGAGGASVLPPSEPSMLFFAFSEAHTALL